jgi:hypothetical protein
VTDVTIFVIGAKKWALYAIFGHFLPMKPDDYAVPGKPKTLFRTLVPGGVGALAIVFFHRPIQDDFGFMLAIRNKRCGNRLSVYSEIGSSFPGDRGGFWNILWSRFER